MNEPIQDAKAIFGQALEIDSITERSVFLKRACGEDLQLRVEVEDLLRANDQAGSFMVKPALKLEDTADFVEIHEDIGAEIGPYKLMEEIGEGGMGVVYVAQQERPMLRKVALKIIKAGMDTKEVIARFEAERQALALMDHPNIAKVLDAGATKSGRPYFAMELVRGIPITDYCDRKRLSTRERLQLFVTTCQAIQHAHQKGVIHRDVKPSNILVTELDGKPLPKVIDFGVAKAINQRLTERTLYTRHHQMVGTPLYMSPEQADLSAMDVDTRSDVYSLGVLLYELLTGVTPFDQERFHTAAYDEMRRIIREEEPPKPSTRISTLGDSAATLTELRQGDPKELRHLLRGELDWIVMKALDKDRNRRYETANGLAADVDRYLHDEAVEACPPSSAYRFRKFARRNQGGLATAAVIGVSLLLATIISIWQASVARKQRDTAQELLKELVSLAILAGDEEKAQDTINKADQAGVSSELITLFRGQLALYYGRTEDAIAELEQVAGQSIAALAMLSYAFNQVQDIEHCEIALDELANRLKSAGDRLTFEDKLFAGQTMINSDMVAGLELVEQALQERSDSPLAKMIHAQILSAYAHNTGDITKVQPSIDEINEAMRWVGEVPEMVCVQVMVHSVAELLGVRKISPSEREAFRADWDVIKDLPMGRVMLLRLLTFLDDPEVPRYIESRSAFTEGELLVYIPILLHYWPPEKVLAFVNEHRDALTPYVEGARARLMALLPHRRAEAEQLCHKVMDSFNLFFPRATGLNTLLLLGKDEQVPAIARDLIDSSTAPNYYGEEIMRFLADGGSRQAFVDGAGEIRVLQMEAWFTVAMLQLAEGKRVEALDSLKKCVATTAGQLDDYWWARAFIRFMNENPNWLSEIASDDV